MSDTAEAIMSAAAIATATAAATAAANSAAIASSAAPAGASAFLPASAHGTDALARLAAAIETRKAANGGNPETSYVARLLQKGPDAFLKKIGEEATEVVMAAKDVDHGGDLGKLVGEVADLWFHSMIALAHYGLAPADVIAELERRAGTSGIEEKALRKIRVREAEQQGNL